MSGWNRQKSRHYRLIIIGKKMRFVALASTFSAVMASPYSPHVPKGSPWFEGTYLFPCNMSSLFSTYVMKIKD
jgi:hypothetical protein